MKELNQDEEESIKEGIMANKETPISLFSIYYITNY